MTDLALWKISIDAGLILALFYLGFRMSKTTVNPRDTAKLMNLEFSLKNLLGEAEKASKHFSGDLEQRQKSLEQLLFDLETVEHRVNKAIASAERERREIQSATVAPRPAQQVSAAATTQATPAPERVQEAPAATVETPGYTQSASFEQHTPEPPSFAGARKPRTNIYGEVIEESVPAKPAAQTYSPQAAAQNAGPAVQRHLEANGGVSRGLSAQVEKQVDGAAAQTEVAALEQIYSIAEKMLAQGESLESVAHRTRLPLKDVNMLAQILDRDAPQESQQRQSDSQGGSRVNATDERLGVLAKPAMRRETTVL